MLKKYLTSKTILVTITFVLFYCIGVHRLSGSSLWLDESIEYFYSKYMFGNVPGGDNTSNMYERIVITFQPPLYNILMYFWLKISITEWWFRFFGVIMGLVGGIGIFKFVEKIWNYKAACLSVITLSCVYLYVYYMYLFVSCIAIYSQYGAAFPIFGFSLVLLVNKFFRKKIKELSVLGTGFFITFCVFIVPLVVFFLSKQLVNQQSYMSRLQSEVSHVFFIKQGVFIDLLNNFTQLVENLFYSSLSIGNCTLHIVVILLLIICVILALIVTKKESVKLIILANLVCLIAYYIAVNMNYYSYGVFGGRHSVFFIPLWIPLIFVSLKECSDFFEDIFITNNSMCIIKGFIVGVLSISLLSNASTINQNWKKEDIRGAVKTWNKEEGYNFPTFLWYTSESGFYYYSKELGKYSEEKLRNVHNLGLLGSKNEYRNFLFKQFTDRMDNSFYLIASHVDESDPHLKLLFETIQDCGYAKKVVYNRDGGLLYLFTSLKHN